MKSDVDSDCVHGRGEKESLRKGHTYRFFFNLFLSRSYLLIQAPQLRKPFVLNSVFSFRQPVASLSSKRTEVVSSTSQRKSLVKKLLRKYLSTSLAVLRLYRASGRSAHSSIFDYLVTPRSS
jgi:hypothetical protein